MILCLVNVFYCCCLGGCIGFNVGCLFRICFLLDDFYGMELSCGKEYISNFVYVLLYRQRMNECFKHLRGGEV